MIRALVFSLLMLIGLSPALQAATGEEQLQAFLKDLKTLKAEFQQTLELPDNGGVYLTHGTFYLKRPGLLRWEYAAPNQQLIVADGTRVWLQDFELEQISHRSQAAALDGTPAQLLSGQGPIQDHFKIKELQQQDGVQWIELLPKDDNAQFKSLRLALVDNELWRLDMYDNFGQTTRFVFTNIQRNPNLNPDLFVFKPPSGVDLIGDL